MAPICFLKKVNSENRHGKGGVGGDKERIWESLPEGSKKDQLHQETRSTTIQTPTPASHVTQGQRSSSLNLRLSRARSWGPRHQLADVPAPLSPAPSRPHSPSSPPSSSPEPRPRRRRVTRRAPCVATQGRPAARRRRRKWRGRRSGALTAGSGRHEEPPASPPASLSARQPRLLPSLPLHVPRRRRSASGRRSPRGLWK